MKVVLAKLIVPFAMVVSVAAQTQRVAPSSGLVNRKAIAYSRRTDSTYVVDRDHGGIVEITSNGETKTIRTGEGPVAIGLNDRTGRVYVLNAGARSVTVIDGDRHLAIATATTPGVPYDVAIDEEKDQIYVSSTYSDKLTVIDGKTNVATKLKTGSADALLTAPSRHELYMMGYESDSLEMLDETTHEVAKLPAGALHLWGMVALGSTLYVAHIQDASVAAIDMNTRTLRSIPTSGMPAALAVDAEHGDVYVASFAEGSVSMIDGQRGSIAWTVQVGGHPQALAVDVARRLLYVADAQRHSISVVDGAGGKLLKTYTVDGSPYALALNTRTHRVFAATLGGTPYVEVPQ